MFPICFNDIQASSADRGRLAMLVECARASAEALLDRWLNPASTTIGRCRST